ncbi:MAG TPA: hypothetical protein VFO78_09895, partial [Candidatus Limnocylindrales bacterium]|nr:hypothetical protein [Candidatus Limnocylindrales bacterium]
MAAPHVAGAIALLKATRPQLSPAEVKEALQYLGNLDWKVATDPDPYHERLLDVSRLGPRGDFGVGVGPPIAIPETGGTASYPITLSRTSSHFERIGLSVSGVPAGVTARFDRTSLYGFDARTATLDLAVPTATKEGTYPVTITASEHGLVRTAIATLVVTGDAPVARPPAVDPQPGSTVGPATVPARISWPAAFDASPISAYEVQSRIDGGAWGGTISTSGSTRTAQSIQEVGRTYQYRVRARDAAGIWSAWASGPTYTGDLVQEASLRVAYRGTWSVQKTTSASAGGTRYATAAGASAKLAFRGRAIGLVAPVGPGRGSARIYFDGVHRTTINFASATTRGQVVMYAIGSATYGVHTIELQLVGNGRVDVDAFVTLR